MLLDNEIEILAQEKWLTIIDNAKKIKGTSSPGNALIPEWYDHDKFIQSQKYMRKNFLW